MSSVEVSINQGIGTVIIENAGKRNAIATYRWPSS